MNAKPGKITWTAEMSVGLAALDRDHRELIDLINFLLEEEEADGRERAAAIATVLRVLHNYTRDHFAREERVMRAVGFPLDGHCRLHRALEGQVEGYSALALLGTDSLDVPVLTRFLQDWLTHHILEEDMAYRGFVAAAPDAAAHAADSFAFGDAARLDPLAVEPLLRDPAGQEA